MIARHWTLSRIAGRCRVIFIELASLEDGSLDIEEYGLGWWGEVGEKITTIRLLTRPPPPCGSLVRTRTTATAEATSPAKIMIVCV